MKTLILTDKEFQALKAACDVAYEGVTIMEMAKGHPVYNYMQWVNKRKEFLPKEQLEQFEQIKKEMEKNLSEMQRAVLSLKDKLSVLENQTDN